MGDARQWLHGLWTFYLGYTDRPVHAASAALLAIFGILVFVDPLFAILAVAAYVAPPVILYVLADDPGARAGRHRSVPDRNPPAGPESGVGREPASSGGPREGARAGSPETDTDSDSDGTDADSDSDGGDGDSDSDGTDADSDGDDGDTDSDSNGTDTDTDSDG